MEPEAPWRTRLFFGFQQPDGFGRPLHHARRSACCRVGKNYHQPGLFLQRVHQPAPANLVSNLNRDTPRTFLLCQRSKAPPFLRHFQLDSHKQTPAAHLAFPIRPRAFPRPPGRQIGPVEKMASPRSGAPPAHAALRRWQPLAHFDALLQQCLGQLQRAVLAESARSAVAKTTLRRYRRRFHRPALPTTEYQRCCLRDFEP